MAEPMRSSNPLARLGYADNIGVLGIGPNSLESASAAQREVDSLQGLAKENAVSFDTGKSEEIHFKCRPRDKPISILINDSRIEPAEHIRWLGVHLDSNLSFKHHVTTWWSKALKMAQHMRRLNPVKRDATPGALVTAVNTCVIPVATFGAEVWWPGTSRPSRHGNVTPPTSFLCGLVDKSIHLALRALLPVWRTTPNAVLHWEAGILVARILLEGYRLRLAVGLNSLDSANPLRSRLGTKAEGLTQHRIRAASISSSDICAYSDGLSEGHGRSSSGFVLQRGSITFKTGQGTLNGGEVYVAELDGATAALEAALSAAVLALQTGRTSSSLRLARVFHEVAKKANTHVRWVPGNPRISRNEEVDAAARAALEELPPRQTQPGYITLAYLRRLMQQYRQNLIDVGGQLFVLLDIGSGPSNSSLEAPRVKYPSVASPEANCSKISVGKSPASMC
ncbi:hypothetical protein K3495_g9999 [Podosphaera aphanis]|nr:hypothetical protein K3495_g9999 [Podosphaera aphanis]